MKIINTEEFNAVTKEGLTLVDFFADWCGPCKMLGPILEKLDEEYPDVTFVKVNVDDNMELAEKFGIMSIPAVYVFKNGEVLNKMVGFSDEGGVRRFIDEAIA